MEFITNPIVAAGFLILLLVFVHEAGHFIVGRMSGIAVEIFSLGFGPPLLRVKRGDTEYRISVIPLGGYVKFYGFLPGEDVPEGVNGTPFNEAGLWARIATVAAGPLANLGLAFVIHTILGSSGISHPQPIIGEVKDGSPAFQAGLQFEDKIVKINEEPIKTWFDMSKHISASPNKKLDIQVMRGGQLVDIELVPEEVEALNILGKKAKVGRAGIVYGAAPAIIGVTGSDTAAANAGLRTGDKITAAKIEGEWVEVIYWRQFVSMLDKLHAVGKKKLPLRVQTLNVRTYTEPEERTLVLVDTRRASGGSVADEVALDLGLIGPELLIDSVDELAKGVLHQRDLILAVGGKPVSDRFEINEILLKNKEKSIAMTVVRKFEKVDLQVPLLPQERQMPSGKEIFYTLPAALMGKSIEPPRYIERYSNIFSAAYYGLKQTVIQTTFLASTLGKLVSGDLPLKSLGGPMLIAKVASDAAKAGWQEFLGTMTLISVNLAVINMFPIPVLDGGQLVLLGVEGIRRRRLSEIAIENFQKVGFVMIFALVVLAVYNDLSRFWASMLQSLSGAF